jgi:hypothetical protein
MHGIAMADAARKLVVWGEPGMSKSEFDADFCVSLRNSTIPPVPSNAAPEFWQLSI